MSGDESGGEGKLDALRARIAELEGRLNREQERFRFVLGATSEGFHLVRPGGLIVDCNESFASNIGYRREEILGMDIGSIDGRPPEAIGVLREALRSSGFIRFTALHHHKDGHPVEVEVSSHVGFIDGEEMFCSFSHPITEQLARERALRETESARAALQAELIESQQAMIRELSTPLIPVDEGVLVMPLVGELDAARSAELLERLLAGINAHRASTVILDVTGVPSVNAEVAAALVRAAQAARLLGAEVMLTGIRPDVARALTALGVDLEGIVALGSLRAGIARAARARPGREEGGKPGARGPSRVVSSGSSRA